MTLEKSSIGAFVIFFGLLTLGLLAISLGIADVANWLLPLIAITSGMILLFEVQIKIFGGFHSIKNYTSMQYVSLVFGALSIIGGTLKIPYFNFSQEWLTMGVIFISAVNGILIIAEWFSQRS